MLQLTGRLVFAPDRGENFRKVGKRNTLILDLPHCRGVAYYYMTLIERELGPWCNLSVPMFGSHVTVVRGNGDRFAEAKCKSVVGRELTVTVDPRKLERTPWSGSNPGFWTLEVITNELQDLRAELDVKSIFPFKPHLTVARENLGFFMHANVPKDPLATALECLKLNDRDFANQQLQRELLDFVRSYRVNPLCTGEELMHLVYKHIPFPAPKGKAKRPWEIDIVNLFCHFEGVSS